MSKRGTTWDLAHEVLSTSVAALPSTLLSVIIVAALISAVLLTAGRAEGSERTVLQSLNTPASRTITVQYSSEVGAQGSAVSRLLDLKEVIAVAAFGPADDVSNVVISGGNNVALREIWVGSKAAPRVTFSPPAGITDGVYVNTEAAGLLGLTTAAGSVADSDGRRYSIRGRAFLSSELSNLGPVVLEPLRADKISSVTSIQVLVDSASHVAIDAASIPNILNISAGEATVTASPTLGQLRSQLGGDLDAQNHLLIASLTAVTCILVFAIQLVLVFLRRKDFGRRRALGATRMLVAELVLMQVVCFTIAGALLGALGSVTYLTAAGLPVPPTSFIAALLVITVLASSLASVLPAVVASRRDPVKELRVP